MNISTRSVCLIQESSEWLLMARSSKFALVVYTKRSPGLRWSEVPAIIETILICRCTGTSLQYPQSGSQMPSTFVHFVLKHLCRGHEPRKQSEIRPNIICSFLRMFSIVIQIHQAFHLLRIPNFYSCYPSLVFWSLIDGARLLF